MEQQIPQPEQLTLTERLDRMIAIVEMLIQEKEREESENEKQNQTLAR